MDLSRRLLFVILFLLYSFVTALGTPQAQSPPLRVDRAIRVRLSGNVHPLARPEFDRGPAPENSPMNRMLLLLNPGAERQNALRTLLQDQQTSTSPAYHKWLSPAEFGQRFGVTDSDLQSVLSWLNSEGLSVTRVSNGRSVIEFSGTAASVRSGFHTEIHKFLVNGREHWANVNDPEIPAALAGLVTGVASLNNFPRQPLSKVMGRFRRTASGQLEPLFTLPLPNGSTVYGVGPGDFATIYNVQPLWNSGIDGTGQGIAVVSPTNINVQDVQEFRSLFGLPAKDPQIVVNGADPGIIPDIEPEAVTDVEWSGAVAKNANISLIVSQGTEASSGIDLSALYAVDNNVAPIISVSYGACEAALGSGGNSFYNQLWQQAAAEGITVLVAAGDNGPAGCDDFGSQSFVTHGLAVSGLASTPFNVAVGGTDFDQAGSPSAYWNASNSAESQTSAKSYIPEMTWNDSCGQTSSPCPPGVAGLVIAGSGGPSSLYAKPAWQSGIGVPPDGQRDLPDVSLFAGAGRNGSIYIICESDQNPGGVPCQLSVPDIEGVGGTSVSAQAFAGIMALVDQANGGRQGNANFVLYKLAAQNPPTCNGSAGPSGSCTFYDISKGTTSVPCLGGTPNCGGNIGLVMPTNGTPAWPAAVGYDYATGLGSVNAQNLVNSWAKASFTATSTSLSVSPLSLTHGQSATVNITVSPSSGSGTPGGNVSLMGNPNGSVRPMGSFALSSGQVAGQTTLLAGGTYSVTAHYAGDGVYAASDSSPVSVTVAPEVSKTLLSLVTFDPNTGQLTSSNATTAPYGSPYILRMDVESASAGKPCYQIGLVGCPTGSLNLSDSGATLDGGSFKLNAQGTAEDLAIQLTGGSHSLQAQYSGDNSYNASTGSSTITITPATTILTYQVPPPPFIVGKPITLSTELTADSSGALPTGAITFYEDGQPLSAPVTVTPEKTCPVCATLLASTTITPTAGDHVFRETYSGDGNYQSAASAGLQIHFLYPVSSFTVSFNPSTVQYGSSTTMTALVGTSNKNLPPTGPVMLFGVGGAVGPIAYATSQDASGNSVLQATAQVTPLYTQAVTASFIGDANYASALSTASTITVTNAPDFTLSLNPANMTVTAGQTATSTLTLTDVNGFTQGALLTCSVPPQMSMTSCTLNPTSVAPANGSTTATAALTILTLPTHSASLHHSATWFLNSSGLFAVVLLMTMSKRQKRNGALATIVVVGLLTIGGVSCGGGGMASSGSKGSIGTLPITGTPAGTYTVTVTGTSNINGQAVTHQQNLSVTVQ